VADGPVSEPALAKVNVFLRVLGRRPDGYHDLETLIQPVTLADGVQVRRSEGLSLAISGDRVREVPPGEENLVLRAARALSAVCGEPAGADILLVKRIPVAAGLGGGSADAAAALRALDRLWGCGLGEARLAQVGLELGSDVPALIHGGPALVRGRGEQVERVATPRTWWVLVPSNLGVAAGEAYAWWDQAGGVTGPDPAPSLHALGSGDPAALGGVLFNDLEPGVVANHAQAGEARERLLSAGALGSVMCGSGPTMAGLARDGAHADEIAAAVGGLAVSSMSGPPPS
jgi:4-diphosphocytidyl-2-C-methyl-D-erythritol kinase